MHAVSNPRFNRALEHLLGHLNATETAYPGTTLKLVYSLAGGTHKKHNPVSSHFPADQEV